MQDYLRLSNSSSAQHTTAESVSADYSPSELARRPIQPVSRGRDARSDTHAAGGGDEPRAVCARRRTRVPSTKDGTTTTNKKGAEAEDLFVPAGTIVGINPCVVARNTSDYGDDADAFLPERWLKGSKEPDADYQARLAAMNTTDLSFGAGARVCIGKNLALLQAYKVVATLAVRYGIELGDPESQWRVTNSWFPKQEGGLDIRLKMRTPDH
ncbi:hypothetical protein PG989_007206 [Apiospora arundinis]